MALKDKSNCKLHKAEDQDAEEVKQQLEMLLPLEKLWDKLDLKEQIQLSIAVCRSTYLAVFE